MTGSDAGALERPAPPMGPMAALTTLEDIAIVSFDIDPAALAAHLPTSLEPELFTLADGRQQALVSAVTFRDVDFRFRMAPFVRLFWVIALWRLLCRSSDDVGGAVSQSGITAR